MAASLLAQYPELARACIVVLLLAAPTTAGWLRTRPRAAWGLVLVSGVLLAALTLLPAAPRADMMCELAFAPRDLLRVEPLANIILFVPLTLALTAATRRPWSAFAIGTGASLLIELLQLGLPMIGRSCTSTDWVANTVGAGLGAALASLGLLLADRRAGRDGGDAPRDAERAGRRPS
ncbi:VanZ family protein [Sanguibacter sp. 25GB23B1]|uniref:VanZ family protein n=1 Tax=unclassified Sanguibacter TaxID=2645534 RepID=UPI0032AED4D1